MGRRLYALTSGIKEERQDFSEQPVCWNTRKKFATYLPRDNKRLVTTDRLAQIQGQPTSSQSTEFQEDPTHLRARLSTIKTP